MLHLISKMSLFFVKMVSIEFTPFIATFVLCAILAAIISTIDSQIMAFTSNVVKQISSSVKNVSINQISKFVTITITILSAVCAFMLQNVKIYQMVQFAWSGFGVMFGPIVLYLRFNKRVSESLIQKTITVCVLTLIVSTLYLNNNSLFSTEDSVSVGFLISFILHTILLITLNKKEAR